MLGLGDTSFLLLLLQGALLCSTSCRFQVAVRMRKVGCSLTAMQFSSTFPTASVAAMEEALSLDQPLL